MSGALLIDTSHYNPQPNDPALKAGGVCGLIAKASEGTGYADPAFGTTRANAHATGLLLGAYHFTRLGNPAAEAAWFVRCLGGRLLPGEFVGLDLEVSAAGVNPVVWVGQWLDAMAGLGVPVRLLYINKSELAGFDWSPIARRGVGLWLADYDGAQSAAGVPTGAFGVLTLKQYTSSGSVVGESGPVDVDWSPLSPAQLAAALTGASPTTASVPEDVMLVRSNETGTVYVWGEFSLTAIPDNPTYGALQAAGITPVGLPQAQIDLIAAQTMRARTGLLTDVHRNVLCRTPDDRPNEAWLFDLAATACAKSVDIDGKVGQPQATVDAAAVGAALAASPGFVQAVVAGVVAGIDGDLAKRFGPTT